MISSESEDFLVDKHVDFVQLSRSLLLSVALESLGLLEAAEIFDGAWVGKFDRNCRYFRRYFYSRGTKIFQNLIIESECYGYRNRVILEICIILRKIFRRKSICNNP